jgi:hypothetical protein
MKKTTPIKNSKKNGKGHAPLPDVLTPAVALAVLEDAVMEAAADNAAMSAPEMIVPDQEQGLVGVPLLGATRIQALADVGIQTLADLHAATVEQIGSAKGVGNGNAERIKAWLAAQPVPAPGMPPPPPEIDTLPFDSPDPVLALDNQTIFDALGEIDPLIARLRSRAGEKGLPKALERQCDKVSAVAAELAEGPDTLTAKQLQQALKFLKRIVVALECTAGAKKLSEKKLGALSDELREHRKSLQKVIGD